MRAPFVAAVLVVAALAGCLTQTSTPDHESALPGPDPAFLVAPKFALLKGESEFIKSHDGTLLHARVFRPDTTSYLPDTVAAFGANALPPASEWRSPILMVMSPYFSKASRENPDDPASMPNYERYAWLIEHFVPKGYAVVLQDVRGTGESGGCLEQTGPLQMQDQYLSIEHYATQPWASGKVGMYGKSYDGETQQSSLVMAPPHLTTIVPLSSVAGQYEWNFYDGVPYTVNGLAGMVSYARIGLTPGTSEQGQRVIAERAGCHGENLKEGADPSGDMNRFWKEREFRLLRGNAQHTSVLYVHGLQDWNVKPNHIRDWYNDLDVPKTAWLGQWEHDYPEDNRFKPEWNRTDWRDFVEKWFDHWLLGVQNGADDWLGKVQVQDSTGAWRVTAAWPPHDAVPHALYPATGKLLPERADAPPAKWTEDSRDADPNQFIPFVPSNPPSHGLRFESEPLAEPLHYAGTPWFNFSASVDRSDTHFAVHLLSIGPDGKAMVINRGYLSAPHRESLESPKPLTEGQVYAFQVRLFPQDDVIPAGHRVGLWVGSVDDWVQPAGTGATVTLLQDAEHPAVLTLPKVTPDPGAAFDAPMKGTA